MRKCAAAFIFYVFSLLGLSLDSCLAQENKAVEFVLEVSRKYETPATSPDFIFVPDGKVTVSNGFTSTVETFYCRQSLYGYLIESCDEDWNSLFGTTPKLIGGKIYAKFGDERLFKRGGRGAPFQYSQTIALMTNEFKNGFLLTENDALGILGLISGLGIYDTFSIENHGTDKTVLHLKLKAQPEIQCLGKLTVSNNIPSTLNICFTNRYKDVMGFYYKYEKSENSQCPTGLDFDGVQLVVSNISKGTFQSEKSVRVLAVRHTSDTFSERSDFGFAVDLPKLDTWVWVGDKIKGMDEKLDFIAKSGGGGLTEPSQSTKTLQRHRKLPPPLH